MHFALCLSVDNRKLLTKRRHFCGPSGIQLFTGRRIKRVTLPWVMLGDSWFMNEWNEGVVLNWSRHLIPWKAFPRLTLMLRWASCELYVERVWWRVHPPSLRKQNRLQVQAMIIIGARVTLPYKFHMNLYKCVALEFFCYKTLYTRKNIVWILKFWDIIWISYIYGVWLYGVRFTGKIEVAWNPNNKLYLDRYPK